MLTLHYEESVKCIKMNELEVPMGATKRPRRFGIIYSTTVKITILWVSIQYILTDKSRTCLNRKYFTTTKYYLSVVSYLIMLRRVRDNNKLFQYNR